MKNTLTTEVVYQSGVFFKILGDTITLYSEYTSYGYNTVAEVDDGIYYLGNELPNLTTAIFAWEYINHRSLTKEEMRRVLTEHNMI